MENLVTIFDYLKKAYNGKKIFVTGHTGFKGAWFLKMLSLLDTEIKGYALAPPNEFDLFNLIDGENKCESVIGDLRNRKKLKDAILSFEPDYLFHFAAQPLVRLSYAFPSETFEINAIGTANVLESIIELKSPCNIVLITTDKVYQNNEWLYPYRETDKLGGYDPYSASKACAELIIDSYRNSFFNVNKYSVHQKAIGVARAGNVIGGGDWAADRLLPDIVKSLAKNETVSLRNPKSVRPWQHVLEPLTGYLFLAIKLDSNPVKYGQAYNFGPPPNDSLSVETIVGLAIKSWGSGKFENTGTLDSPHEAGLLKLDISKAMNELDWNPIFNAIEAVKYTIDWYKQYYDSKVNMNEYTQMQIINYLNNKVQ